MTRCIRVHPAYDDEHLCASPGTEAGEASHSVTKVSSHVSASTRGKERQTLNRIYTCTIIRFNRRGCVSAVPLDRPKHRDVASSSVSSKGGRARHIRCSFTTEKCLSNNNRISRGSPSLSPHSLQLMPRVSVGRSLVIFNIRLHIHANVDGSWLLNCVLRIE